MSNDPVLEAAKQTVFNLAKAQNCKDVKYILAVQSFADFVSLLLDFAQIFSCMKDYLGSLLSVFDTATLENNHIFFNTIQSAVLNPVFIAKSSVTLVTVNSASVAELHVQAGGEYIGKNKIGLIYGGGIKGLMGAVANAAMENGGKVTGIIPQLLTEWGKSAPRHY